MDTEMPAIPMWLVWALILLAISLILLGVALARNQQGLSIISSFLKIFG